MKSKPLTTTVEGDGRSDVDVSEICCRSFSTSYFSRLLDTHCCAFVFSKANEKSGVDYVVCDDAPFYTMSYENEADTF